MARQDYRRAGSWLLLLAGFASAAPRLPQPPAELLSIRVESAPEVDGRASDPAWRMAPAVTVPDAVSGVPMTLRSVYAGDTVYWLVTYPDERANLEHKTLHWNPAISRYQTGPEREDTFVFKWAMDPDVKDLGIRADRSYQADIWFWKACRTDPSGFADDKVQTYTRHETPGSVRIISRSDRPYFLSRRGDSGQAAYRVLIYPGFSGPRVPRFASREPGGSRADVRAKGHWEDGRWTLEFARRLLTGHADDVQFDVRLAYLFGVSRWEIDGRGPDPRIDQPLFGAGDVDRLLRLRFQP